MNVSLVVAAALLGIVVGIDPHAGARADELGTDEDKPAAWVSAGQPPAREVLL